MKGLIIKDILNLKNYGRSILLIVAFYGIFAYTINDAGFLGGMIVLLMTMMSISSFSYDDLAKWDKYALSLPISRKDMVMSKYLLSIIFIVLGAALSFVIVFVISNIKSSVNLWELLLQTYSSSAVAIIFISVLMPLLYKFGVEKSRIMIMAVFAIPTLLLVLLSKLGIAKPSEDQLMFLLKMSPIIVIAVMMVSAFISYNIYKKKDM
ncbi:ABC-2 family transporter protein [Clostridium amylolyticum]|uniref:ABC-2 family transporter protein n=1 Tax=Clostridium amylolyticum TaxID=1121298 RepID=A0A1M6ILN2_9CLOT|nr:ABC-2 transporter permease [Clostridium amylolyticum]SHJ35350.1 ABC-2 family transporter protein [Clostridium amylolyticum]